MSIAGLNSWYGNSPISSDLSWTNGELPLTRDAFEGWLRGLSPDAIVGSAGHPLDCPIARAATEAFRMMGLNVNVQVGYMTVYVGSHTGVLTFLQPDWMRRFVFAIDQAASGFKATDYAVSAALALEVLYATSPEIRKTVDNGKTRTDALRSQMRELQSQYRRRSAQSRRRKRFAPCATRRRGRSPWDFGGRDWDSILRAFRAPPVDGDEETGSDARSSVHDERALVPSLRR